MYHLSHFFAPQVSFVNPQSRCDVIFLIYQKASFLRALCLEKLFKKGKNVTWHFGLPPPPPYLTSSCVIGYTGRPRYPWSFYPRICLFTNVNLVQKAKFLAKMCLFICEFSICGPKLWDVSTANNEDPPPRVLHIIWMGPPSIF